MRWVRGGRDCLATGAQKNGTTKMPSTRPGSFSLKWQVGHPTESAGSLLECSGVPSEK